MPRVTGPRTITIRKRWTRPFAVLMAFALLFGFWLLGRQISPRSAGRPLPYTPAVRAVVAYQQRAGRWVGLLGELDRDIERVLGAPLEDPYGLSRRVDALLGRSSDLVQEVAAHQAPGSLAGLAEICEAAVVDYLATAEAVSRWAGAPDQAHAAAAREALELARLSLVELQASPWLIADEIPAGPEAPARSSEPAGKGQQPSPWGQ